MRSAALKWIFRAGVPAAPLALTLALGAGAWAQVPGEKIVGNVVFNIGIAPEEQISTEHPSNNSERQMHLPRARSDRDHLVLSLADAGTGSRIDDATVTASISRMGMDHVRRDLERMDTGGTVTYGNYFDLRAPGPYLIRLEVRRPGAPAPTVAEFDYRNR